MLSAEGWIGDKMREQIWVGNRKSLSLEDWTMKQTNCWEIMRERFGNQQRRPVKFALVMTRKEGAVNQPLVRDMEIRQA